MCPRKVGHIIRKYEGINFWLSDLFRLRDSRVNELGEKELKRGISLSELFGCLLFQQHCKITKKLQQSFPVFLNNVSYPFTLISECSWGFFCFRVFCESSELLPGALLCEWVDCFVFLIQGVIREAEQFDTAFRWQSCYLHFRWLSKSLNFFGVYAGFCL